MHTPSFLRRGLLLATLLTTPGLPAQEADLGVLTRIRQEGFRRSKVMDTLGELSDRIGPRLTGSASLRHANDWTRDQLAQWGLVNARLEPWGPFGADWAFESAAVRMVTPDVAQLYAIPRPWSPGTNGPVRGFAVKASLATKEDLEKNKGKLTGKIVLLETPPAAAGAAAPTPGQLRYTDQELEDLFLFPIPASTRGGADDAARAERLKRFEFASQLREFLAAEKPLAVLSTGPRNLDGTIFVQASANSYEKGRHDPVPMLAMTAEHHGRIVRLLDRKVPVELEVNVATAMNDDAPAPVNTLADLPGSDPKLKDEIIMLGAHLDSWAGGTGATDNAFGCAVVMEAARILQALDLRPRRTIRVALWTGEEQGLLGSAAYVEQQFAARPPPTDPAEAKLPKSLWRTAGRPLAVKPAHARLSAYFNIDNGAGKLRGIYAQENAAAVPLFERWIAPLKDLGVTTVTMRNTGSTDHIPFDNVGLPGFQFIQDRLDYNSRTHHSNMDTVEHVKPEDAAQAAVVLAWFAYNAAMRDEMLPRKPMPVDEKPAPAEKPAAAAAK